MEFNQAEWERELDRPIPAPMAAFFEWLTQFEYGDLGYFELTPENLARSSGYDGMARWGATTWGFMRLPEGSVIALCEAVEPPAVVCVGSEGELETLSESFEEFLLSWAEGEVVGGDVLEDDDIEDCQVKAFEAFKSWLHENEIKAPPIRGPFDFAAYADGDDPVRIEPGQKQNTSPAYSAQYLAIAKEMGPTWRRLCNVLGRTADDADIAALTQQLFGKAPPQSIGNAKYDDTVGMYQKKVAFQMTFNRNVLNRKYPPVPTGKKAVCPWLSNVYVTEDCDEPLLFGLHGDAMWQELERRFPQNVEVITDEEGRTEKWFTLLIDEQRHIELVLWTTGHGTRGYAKIVEGRELSSPESAGKINMGAGLFAQWALENGWLDRTMLAGHEDLLEAMAKRERRPSQLTQAAFDRGFWDTHLLNAPELRDFSYAYFHHMDGFWITQDLRAMFGEREGPYGHDEAVLDADPPEIYDRVFAKFSAQFEAYKKAKPARL